MFITNWHWKRPRMHRAPVTRTRPLTWSYLFSSQQTPLCIKTFSLRANRPAQHKSMTVDPVTTCTTGVTKWHRLIDDYLLPTHRQQPLHTALLDKHGHVVTTRSSTQKQKNKNIGDLHSDSASYTLETLQYDELCAINIMIFIYLAPTDKSRQVLGSNQAQT